jgi:hypothetical protein
MPLRPIFWGLVIFMSFIARAGLGHAQISKDWRNRYGEPASERYILRDGFIMTVSYSATGQTCRLNVEATNPQSRDNFEGILTELVPIGQRGKRLNSFNLSNLLESTQYERVSIALYPISREHLEQFKEAEIAWHGIQCIHLDQSLQK